jgi:hypothetical protein
MRVVRNAEGVEDLPRLADGTALLGDPRNDENLSSRSCTCCSSSSTTGAWTRAWRRPWPGRSG